MSMECGVYNICPGQVGTIHTLYIHDRAEIDSYGWVHMMFTPCASTFSLLCIRICIHIISVSHVHVLLTWEQVNNHQPLTLS